MTDALRERLGYTFRQPDLLRQALTHRSFGAPNYERLEFVGDAVLNCVVGVTLFEQFPAVPEGDLSRMRAGLVNQESLARVARALDLGEAIRFGDGELRVGRDRPSILADALEALFGAAFLDGGFDAARTLIVHCYGDALREVDPTSLGKDPKTRLQEWLQARKLPVPEYAVVATSGEAHEQHFVVECRIPALEIATVGDGASRKVAEQVAAEAAGVLAAGHDAEKHGRQRG